MALQDVRDDSSVWLAGGDHKARHSLRTQRRAAVMTRHRYLLAAMFCAVLLALLGAAWCR
jgi:hypothetical protein